MSRAGCVGSASAVVLEYAATRIRPVLDLQASAVRACPARRVGTEYLRLAKQHVIDAERAISPQRWSIERLRALDADVSDAEALLGTFLQTLVAMQQHLDVESGP